MPMDRSTIAIQLWASSRIMLGELKTKRSQLPAGSTSLSTEGIRPKIEHEIIGLTQTLAVILPFALEMALKALHQELSPNAKVKRTHNLWHLFDSLPSDVKARISSQWEGWSSQNNEPTRYTFCEFLKKHKLDFEKWRYMEQTFLYFPSNEYECAIGAVLVEISKLNPVVARNIMNIGA